MAPKRKDYTGQRFGCLTAIKLVNDHGPSRWLCRCDCGTKKVVRVDHLVNGDTVSCGCYRHEMGKRMATENGIDARNRLYPGDRFGRWTVLREDKSRGYPYRYICRCDCGTVRSVMRRSLVTDSSQSCGCYHREVSAQQARDCFTKHGKCSDPEYIRFLKRRRYHADREWTHEMDKLLFELQPSCVICESTDDLEIDHVVPSIKGGKLEPGNVVVLCRSCNASKHDKDLSGLPADWQRKIKRAAQIFAHAWAEIVE